MSKKTKHSNSAFDSEDFDDHHDGEMMQQTAGTSSSSSNSFLPFSLLDDPYSITEFRTGRYGETNNIAMRKCLPEGTQRAEVSLHQDH